MGKKITTLLLLSLLLFSWPVTGWAATYQVTEDELTRLETVFQELKSTNAILMADSTKSQMDLIRALKLLKESQAELTKLSSLLTTLQAESNLAKNDLKQANAELAKANQYFEQYAKEQKKVQARLRTEKTFWMIAAGAATYFAVKK